MAFKHPHRKLDPSVLNPEFPSNDSSQKSTTRRKQLHHLMPESISGKQQKRSARASRSDRSRSTRFSSTKVKFNLRFFVISLAVSLMAAAGLHAWHWLCVKRQANYYLTHADHLEADGKMRAAARAPSVVPVPCSLDLLPEFTPPVRITPWRDLSNKLLRVKATRA